jgi:hypothetical protein
MNSILKYGRLDSHFNAVSCNLAVVNVVGESISGDNLLCLTRYF